MYSSAPYYHHSKPSSSTADALTDRQSSQNLISNRATLNTPTLLATEAVGQQSPLGFDSHSIMFDQTTLDGYTSLLTRSLSTPASGINPHHIRYKFSTESPVREAGVLVPLCTVNGIPSVLFTVRSSNLRTHSNEVSFPGGVRDAVDTSIQATALRETMEEIGIPSTNIQILGQSTPAPSKTYSTIVTPYIGFIRSDIKQVSDVWFNKDEVAQVVAISMVDLLDPSKQQIQTFRGIGVKISTWPVPGTTHRIWGLTAYILDQFINNIVTKYHFGEVGTKINNKVLE